MKAEKWIEQLAASAGRDNSDKRTRALLIEVQAREVTTEALWELLTTVAEFSPNLLVECPKNAFKASSPKVRKHTPTSFLTELMATLDATEARLSKTEPPHVPLIQDVHRKRYALRIEQPLAKLTKADTVKVMSALGVDYDPKAAVPALRSRLLKAVRSMLEEVLEHPEDARSAFSPRAVPAIPSVKRSTSRSAVPKAPAFSADAWTRDLFAALAKLEAELAEVYRVNRSIPAELSRRLSEVIDQADSRLTKATGPDLRTALKSIGGTPVPKAKKADLRAGVLAQLEHLHRRWIETPHGLRRDPGKPYRPYGI